MKVASLVQIPSVSSLLNIHTNSEDQASSASRDFRGYLSEMWNAREKLGSGSECTDAKTSLFIYKQVPFYETQQISEATLSRAIGKSIYGALRTVNIQINLLIDAI